MHNQDARRRNPVRAVAAALGALMFGMALAAVPAQAAPPGAAQYVALGDSYAAGQGAAPYTDPACFVSKKGYPVISDKLRDVELTANAACSGNSTGQVIASLPFAVGPATDVITVTAGGIDLGTNTVLATCAPAPQSFDCASAINAAYTRLGDGTVFTAVATMVATIRAHAPTARLVVTGYPLLFEATHPFAPVANPAVQALNLVIASAATSQGAHYVDVAGAFAGHGIGSADPWINFNPANLADPANFHPNGDGYRHGYYGSLVTQGAFTGLN
ncbi:SGNH/GDSL hydrolase family protein [Pseudarthrobacter sp. J64]|uniref:SGNH/GDSL hydrolase family protein n=1 Tax=Pseudarthrobacter sp. J64 TaxID=3116485 RepID=UPI002E80F584|nr:SGNH/GDSL hydrolase family protein [Pseudarthrobacter sp. J64]MEE2567888.1 SGNH/GDSL hydrolase family protein [Pseudarthrobacter sp. J64]